MVKTAVLFSGQGAQKPGMGKDLYEGSTAARELFERASAVLPEIKELCFDADQETLNKTINTQPCTFVVDSAAYAALKEATDIVPSAMAGFSLGEYAAAAASGMIGFEDALRTVLKRAEWMTQCAEECPGSMAAVMGKTAEEVEALIKETSYSGLLQCANYNSPSQTVVAADTDGMEAFLALCSEKKVKAIKLAVSGAFHTPAMSAAAEKLFEEFGKMDFASPSCDLYANVTGLPYGDDIKRTLADQTMSPVRFTDTVGNIMKSGITTFIECGEGKVLSGLVRKTSKELSVYNVSDTASLAATAEAIK